MIDSAPLLFLARSSAIAAGAESIQLFPPGKHAITPSNADPSKKPTEVELVIDEATATLLEDQRAGYQAKADAGEGDAPYLDFNHDDKEASAWPKRIFWGGDDPLLGGIRAEVEWSAAGEEAIQGKTYRRFSPAFYADKGRITGAPINMGGLVNRAAFTKIQPLFAKENQPSPITNPQSEIAMNEAEIKALQEENAALKKQLEELQMAAKAAAEKEAEATVALAAKEGRIGTSPELQAKWKATLIANPAAKELLLAMAPNPALMTDNVIKAKAAETTEEPAVLLAKYNALPRAEQSAFFAKHAAAIKTAHNQAIR